MLVRSPNTWMGRIKRVSPSIVLPQSKGPIPETVTSPYDMRKVAKGRITLSWLLMERSLI